jgi:hypothetical protein
VLVRTNGIATDVHTIATWGSGIRIAAFRRRDELATFAASLGRPVEWVPFDEEEFARRGEHVRRALDSVNTKH